VRTPALSVLAVAGAPAPVIVYAVFGVRSDTYWVVAPDARYVTVVNVAGQSCINITSEDPTRAPSKLVPEVELTRVGAVAEELTGPHCNTLRNRADGTNPASTLSRP
jgi:hypothetical protein